MEDTGSQKVKVEISVDEQTGDCTMLAINQGKDGN
jgi:hypothetical protein